MMTTDTTVKDTSLRIERHLDAPPERVYAACTEPSQMSRWMSPSPEMECTVEADTRVGGKYRIEMKEDAGTHVAVGEFTELDPPRRVAYTWRWLAEEGVEGAAEFEAMGETLVTIDIHPADGGTRFVLVHERFPSREAVEPHVEGWTGCVERLVQAI